MPEPHDADRPTVLVTEGDRSPHPTVDAAPRFTDQPTVTLPSGLEMPKLGLGTWQMDEAEARTMTRSALELGLRLIDTAQMYGNERGVGLGLDDSRIDREEVFITTKIDNENHEPEDLIASVEDSLRRLGTDHVDLLLVHWPTSWDRIGATLTTLSQVQASGLALHIGVSNFTLGQLDQVGELAPLEVLQVECHPFLQQRELRSWCVERNWAFTAYSPLARGEVRHDDTLRSIAGDHDTDPTAIAIAWLLSKPQVTTIPKTTNADHLAANRSALDIELSDDEIRRLDDLDAGRRTVDPDFAPWNRQP